MIEFVECPLLRKRITLKRCEQCPEHFHGGVRLNLTVEAIEINGSAGPTVRTQIDALEMPAFTAVHPPDQYQVTIADRFLLCRMPRRMPIEVVEG